MISGPTDKDVVPAAALENLDVGEVIDPDHRPAEIVVGIAGRQIELHRARGIGVIERVPLSVAREVVIACVADKGSTQARERDRPGVAASEVEHAAVDHDCAGARDRAAHMQRPAGADLRASGMGA